MNSIMKENRIVHEVVVPHSPAPELVICWEPWGPLDGSIRVWIKGNKTMWEVGGTLHSAIGALVSRLDSVTVERYDDYWLDDCDQNP